MACNERVEIVLVTGSSGLVGNSLAKEVRTDQVQTVMRNYDFVFVSSKDADLSSSVETKLIFDKYRPSFVIHLAAKVGGLYANMRNNDTFYKLNKRINENVLRESFDYRVKKCISCLSTCIFPDQVELPLDESKVGLYELCRTTLIPFAKLTTYRSKQIHSGPPHESNSGYSLAKREVDLLNRCLNRDSPDTSRFTAVIPTNLYGEHDNFDLDEAHVIPGLIHRAYLAVMEAIDMGSHEATLNVMGSGNPLRQFVYAPDLARILIWCLRHYEDEEPIIICPDETLEYRIRDVAKLICDIYIRKFSIDIKLQFDPSHPDGQSRKTASNGKLKKLLPDFEFTSLESGLQKVIDWFCISYPNVRK